MPPYSCSIHPPSQAVLPALLSPCPTVGLQPGGCRVPPTLPAPLQSLLLAPLPFASHFFPSSRCPNGAPGAPHRQQQTQAENICPDSQDQPLHPCLGSDLQPSQLPFLWGSAKKNPTNKTQTILGKWAMLQAGALAKATSGLRCFWLLWVWEEGRSRDSILSLAIRGFKALNLNQGKQSALA